MSRQFVDTNVLLYAYSIDEGERHDTAAALVARLGRERGGAISVQVLQEFYVNAVRQQPTAIGRTFARDQLRTLRRWPTHAPLPSDVLEAAEIAEQHTLSFWDAMIVRSAYEMDCDVLWTEDLNAGQRIAGVEVRNPFADEA